MNMTKIILPLILTLMPVAAVAQPSPWYLLSGNQQESVDRMCSKYIGVEYGTDNLTPEQWHSFRSCRDSMANGLARPLVVIPYSPTPNLPPQ